MSKIGTTDITGIMLGSTEIVKAYLGSDVVYQKSSPLPYDAQVEYIGSSGTQWIDTGVDYNSSLIVEARVNVTYVHDTVLFGMYSNEGTARRWAVHETTNNRIRPYLNTVTNIYISFSWQTWHVLTMDNRYVTVDNKKTDTKASAFNLNSPPTITIFGRNNQNISTQALSTMKLSYLKVTDGSVLVRDFIPVRVGQVGYLYDKVTKQLFGNGGTGDFALGNDVNV